MRCEEVQEQFARDAVTPALQEAVDSHVSACDACRSVKLLYSQMETALKSAPVWTPPPDFAEMVVLRADLPSRHAPAPAWLSRVTLKTVAWGVAAAIVATAGFGGERLLQALPSPGIYQQFARVFSEALIANTIPMAWASVAISLCVSAWFTRKALR